MSSGSNFDRIWDIALVAAFTFGSVVAVFPSVLYPTLIGSHAVIYTAAAAAMVSGGDPWVVGPPGAIFAGPPTMLISFMPFIPLPETVIRASWIAIDIAVAIWAIRRAGLPGYWIAFPPLVQSIVLGHPEVLLLGLVVVPGALSGLAVLVKPYGVVPLLAEHRWRALVVAAMALVVTAPFVAWPRFLLELPKIALTIARGNNGDPVFGDPVPMAIAIVALLALGLRRALWLSVPVLWPYAQPNYKVMTIPAIAPVLAIAWAIPIPGFTLGGIVVLAALVTLNRWRPLPAWLQSGIRDHLSERAADDAGDLVMLVRRLLPLGRAGAVS
jgi:hypothetical protein